MTARTWTPWTDSRLTTSLPTVSVAPVIRIMAASPLGAQRARLPKWLCEVFVLHNAGAHLLQEA